MIRTRPTNKRLSTKKYITVPIYPCEEVLKSLIEMAKQKRTTPSKLAASIVRKFLAGDLVDVVL
jgi:hypothetical protein